MNENSNVNQIDDSTSNSNIINCPKCGHKMKKTARCCMNCGYLNYAHPENKSMRQYAWQSIKKGQFIDTVNTDQNKSVTETNISDSSLKHYRACLVTNLIIFVFFTLILLLSVLLTGNGIIYTFVVLLLMGYLFILAYSSQRILIKGGQPWWSVFVPLYGNYTYFDVAVGKGWMFLLTFIPVIGLFILLYSLYSLGKRFYKSGWLTLLFPFIMIPIIGLEKNSEMSIFAKERILSENKRSWNGKTVSENKYGVSRFFITLIVLILIIVVIVIAWPVIKPIIDVIYEFFKEQMEFYK